MINSILKNPKTCLTGTSPSLATLFNDDILAIKQPKLIYNHHHIPPLWPYLLILIHSTFSILTLLLQHQLVQCQEQEVIQISLSQCI